MTTASYYDLVKHDAIHFLIHARAGCYRFEIENGRLKVSPAHSIDDEMADLIRVHKTDLIKIL